MFAAGDLDPTELIPIGYLKHGTVTAFGRYYDNEGNVYRFSEVVSVLRARKDTRDALRKYDRNSNTVMIWYIVYALAVPVFPLNSFFLIPVIIYSTRAQESFADAVVIYNED